MPLNNSVKAVLMTAILKSVKEIGLEKFKQTSFFGSSQSNLSCDSVVFKKAA